MDDVERALDDAINTFKCMTRDERMLPGGGATEIELAKQLTTYGEVRLRRRRRRRKWLSMLLLQACPGLEQYAIKKFAQSLETVPRALAENAGFKVCVDRREMYVYICVCVCVCVCMCVCVCVGQ